MEDLEQRMRKKIEVLRKNREAVPLDTLKTKYLDAYSKLICEIKEGVEELLTKVLCEGIKVPEENGTKIASLIDDKRIELQTKKKASVAVFKHYNLDEAIYACRELRNAIVPLILEHGAIIGG